MVEASSLTIPCHWDTSVLDEISQMNAGKSDLQVKEIYGVLAEGGPIGHGRATNAVVEVSPEQAIDFRIYAKEKGLDFTYLLNAPFTISSDIEEQRELSRYLTWILQDFQPDALTITSYDLMKHIRQIGSDIPIHISTIAGVKKAEDLEKYLDVQPNRIVFHHDLGKDWTDLREVATLAAKAGIESEILVTESCLYQCSTRAAHYISLAKKDNDQPFHTICNSRKLMHPYEFLLAGGVIRPEDIALFEEMGVKYFKLSGRSKPVNWLPEVVSAYLERDYSGNLIRLLGIDPSLEAENWIYLNNKALEGFLSNFPFDQNYQNQVGYCNGWISRLYDQGDFKLLDGTIFQRVNNALTLVGGGGERAKQIILKERKI